MFNIKKRFSEFSIKLDGFIDELNKVVSREHIAVEELRKEVESLKQENIKLHQDNLLIEVNVEKRLALFHKEITDKYFATLQDIFRTNKEISLIDNLAKAIDDKELTKLKTSLMQPLLEAKWKDQEKQKVAQTEGNIKSKGEKLVALQKELHDKYLVLNRQEQDTSVIEGQLKILELIIGGKDEIKS